MFEVLLTRLLQFCVCWCGKTRISRFLNAHLWFETQFHFVGWPSIRFLSMCVCIRMFKNCPGNLFVLITLSSLACASTHSLWVVPFQTTHSSLIFSVSGMKKSYFFHMYNYSPGINIQCPCWPGKKGLCSLLWYLHSFLVFHIIWTLPMIEWSARLL